MLILRQFVEHVSYLVIAATLNRLLGAEHLVDGRAQRLGPINDEQILTIGGQSLITKVCQQAFYCSRVFRRTRFDAQDVLLPLNIHAHGAR